MHIPNILSVELGLRSVDWEGVVTVVVMLGSRFVNGFIVKIEGSEVMEREVTYIVTTETETGTGPSLDVVISITSCVIFNQQEGGSEGDSKDSNKKREQKEQCSSRHAHKQRNKKTMVRKE
jgi:hypothetical protein